MGIRSPGTVRKISLRTKCLERCLQLFQIWKGSVCPIPRQLCCGRLVPPQALIPCAAIFITGRGVADRPLVVSAAPVADCPVGRVSCGVWLRVALRWRG